MVAEERLNQALDCAFSRIRDVIAHSGIPEDPIHAEDTLSLILELRPDADAALQLAALGHDIERALPETERVNRAEFSDYDLFKAAHAENSARILRGLLKECNLPPDMVDRIVELVRRHETGGDADADLLKDADSLSFFRVNMPYYLEREGWQNTRYRCLWGMRRLSPSARKRLHAMMQVDGVLQEIFLWQV
jgi:hypothetical protein